MTGFFFVASALCGAHAEQHNPDWPVTFGFVANAFDNTVSVIDTASNKVVATIPVGRFPDGVATTPDGTHAYVTNKFDATVSVIDTTSNKVVVTIPVGANPSGVATTPDGTHAYVTNSDFRSVSVIDTASNTVVDTILVGVFPTGVATTPDGSHPPERDDRRHQPLAYVTNQVDNTVSVIETAGNTVVATIPVGDNPNGVAITPDGTRAYVTNLGTVNELATTVSVIDTANNTVVATIPAGKLPSGVAITPDGTHAYVTNTIDSTVSVIDTASNTMVATIPVGLGSFGVAITSDGTRPYEHDDRRHQPLAYVTNNSGNTVSVIDTANNKVVATIPVGNFPFALAFATVTPSHRSSEQ
jgi:YVTN family beta-propeller protein